MITEGSFSLLLVNELSYWSKLPLSGSRLVSFNSSSFVFLSLHSSLVPWIEKHPSNSLSSTVCRRGLLLVLSPDPLKIYLAFASFTCLSWETDLTAQNHHNWWHWMTRMLMMMSKPRASSPSKLCSFFSLPVFSFQLSSLEHFIRTISSVKIYHKTLM